MAVAMRELEVKGERAIDLGFGWLVASKSEPGAWYEVRNGHCTCKGYEFRGKCRHVAAIAEIQTDPERAEVQWSERFGGWLVIWVGYQHGGVHFNKADADAHAAELAADPDFDTWITMHNYGTGVR